MLSMMTRAERGRRTGCVEEEEDPMFQTKVAAKDYRAQKSESIPKCIKDHISMIP